MLKLILFFSLDFFYYIDVVTKYVNIIYLKFTNSLNGVDRILSFFTSLSNINAYKIIIYFRQSQFDVFTLKTFFGLNLSTKQNIKCFSKNTSYFLLSNFFKIGDTHYSFNKNNLISKSYNSEPKLALT